MCECHVSMCQECADHYRPFAVPAIGHFGQFVCEKCLGVSDANELQMVPQTRIAQVDGCPFERKPLPKIYGCSQPFRVEVRGPLVLHARVADIEWLLNKVVSGDG